MMEFQGFDWLSNHGMINNYTMPEKRRPLKLSSVAVFAK